MDFPTKPFRSFQTSIVLLSIYEHFLFPSLSSIQSSFSLSVLFYSILSPFPLLSLPSHHAARGPREICPVWGHRGDRKSVV